MIKNTQQNNIIIQVKNIYKKFNLYNTPHLRLKELLSFGLANCHEEFWALNDISFEVKAGETLALIGPNGSGKSTLLRLLHGISKITKGTIAVTGTIASLLELGVGFVSDLTGRENIYLLGAIAGFSRQKIRRLIPRIEEFADIGKYIDQPVKYYSSGMFVRLAFASAITVDPDILLVDEALAVGDINFQQKCFRFFDEFKKKGNTLILVSHDMNLIKTLCDRAILLDKGHIINKGSPDDVVDHYLGLLFQQNHIGEREIATEVIESKTEEFLDKKIIRIGTNEIDLISIEIVNEDNKKVNVINHGEYFIVKFTIIAEKNLSAPHYGISFRDKKGIEIFGVNTYTMHICPPPQKKRKETTISYRFKCLLAQGDYTVSLGVAEGGIEKKGFQFKEYLLSLQNISQFKVVQHRENIIFNGIYNMEPEVTVGNNNQFFSPS